MKPRLPSLLLAVAMTAACATKTTIPTPPQVDLQRFMGPWYVIANIPTWPERDAYNPIEHYALGEDGRIRTTYTYRKGGFDAPLDTMHPVATVREGTGNAVWGMQFVWPGFPIEMLQAEYVIAHVDDAYTETIIARSDRDYAWIMARTPTLPEADIERLKRRLRDLGYELDGLRMVPQQWPETGPDPRPAP